MRKMKKVDGYLIVKFNAKEMKKYGSTLGEYGIIDAELYTGHLDVDKELLAFCGIGNLEEAVAQVKSLAAEVKEAIEETTAMCKNEDDGIRNENSKSFKHLDSQCSICEKGRCLEKEHMLLAIENNKQLIKKVMSQKTGSALPRYVDYLNPTERGRDILVNNGRLNFNGYVYEHETLVPYNGTRVQVNGYPDRVTIFDKSGIFIAELHKYIVRSK